MGLFNNAAKVEAAFAPYLEPGEQVRHVSSGTWKSSLPLWAAIISALLGGKALRGAVPRYMIALTDRRFVVLRYEEMTMKILEDRSWPLTALPPVKASNGMGYDQIEIDDPAQPFKAYFMGNKRQGAQAISAALAAAATPA
jgi:hypothetical protein